MMWKLHYQILIMFVLLSILLLPFHHLSPVSLDIDRQEIDDNWYLSEGFTLTNNESFTVTVHSVEFEFLYYKDWGALDIPYPIYIAVHFSDSVTEILETIVGGMLSVPYRLVLSNHTTPQAAIISSYSHEEWYGWYYAVSPDETTPTTSTDTSNPTFDTTLFYGVAVLAWIIALTIIVVDYRRR